MTLKDKVGDKLTSVMALLLMLFGIVLCAKFAFSDMVEYTNELFQLFAYGFTGLLGYYIGRDRQQPQPPPGSGKQDPG